MTGFSWDWSIVWIALPTLWKGLYYTVIVTFASFALSLALGLALAIVLLGQIPVVGACAAFLVNFLRGTPLLIQIYFVFYVLPRYGLSMSILTTAILGLGISNSAMVAEVFRTSIETVRRGQWEACHALGLPLHYVWWNVIMPQAMRTATPMLGSYFILAFKESAIVSVIGVNDLMEAGMEVGMQHFRFTEPLTMVAIIYLAISYVASRGIRAMEKSFNA